MPVKKKQPLYAAEHISFTYGDAPVLTDISFSIAPGEYWGIVGPNGGGKSTLLKVLLGILKPTSGKVFLGGKLLLGSSLRNRIGYVPQRPSSEVLFPGTVREIVESGRTPLKGFFASWNAEDEAAVTAALETAGIAHLSDRRFITLSGGERQRALIARALAADPIALFLDEPTSAVDATGQEQFYAFLRELHEERGMTIVLVSHDEDLVSHEVDHVLCLNRHIICHGPAVDVKKILHAHNLSSHNLSSRTK